MRWPPLETDILAWFQDRHARSQAGEPDILTHGRAWIERGQHRAYLRYHVRPFLALGRLHLAATVANISLPPRSCGKGWFTHTLLPALETWARHERLPLVVENTFNPRLEAFLLRRGYRSTGLGEVERETLAWGETYPH